MKFLHLMACGVLLASTTGYAQKAKNEPIIDAHLHAMWFGKAVNCSGDLQEWRPRDASPTFTVDEVRSLCNRIVEAPPTQEAYETEVLKNLEQYNIIGVTSGMPDMTARWHQKLPARIIPGVFGSPGDGPRDLHVDALREQIKAGKVKVLGEIIAQYSGIAPDNPAMEPIFALAEELDVPVAIHMGPGAPAAAYVGQPNYLVSASNPLALESVLRKHPRLRIQVMHASWPFVDAMIAMMYSHPQIYVDTAILDWGIPRQAFYYHLKRLVDAGFANRIMYGSDEFFFPQAMKDSIDAIQNAPFLSEKQKRDIFYNNAARFYAKELASMK